MSSVVEIVDDLSNTLTKHLRLMAMNELSKRKVDFIEHALGDFLSQFRPAPELSLGSGRQLIVDPASSIASNEERGKRTMNERQVDAIKLTLSDSKSQFRSAPDLLLGSSMRRRRSSISTSPTKLIAEPASATGNEWQRRMMRSYEKGPVPIPATASTMTEVENIVRDDEEMAKHQPHKSSQQLWRKAKLMLSLLTAHKPGESLDDGTVTAAMPLRRQDPEDVHDNSSSTKPKSTKKLWARPRSLLLAILSATSKKKAHGRSVVVDGDDSDEGKDEDEESGGSRDNTHSRYMWEENEIHPPISETDARYSATDALQETDSRWVIAPDNPIKAGWDFCLGLAVMYIAILLPVRLSFDVETSDGALALDLILDIAFILDIVLNFVTGYVDPLTKDVVMKNRDIARHYVTSWLLVDIASSVPTEIISRANIGLGSNIGLLKMVKLLKLFRMFRLLRQNWFSDLEMSGIANPNLIRMMKFLGAFGMCLHFTACCYWAVAVHEGFGEDVWVPTEYIGYEVGLTDQYSAALYFAIAGMLGNHMSPHTPGQMRVTGIIMFLGLVVNATIIGSASSLLSNLNAVAVEKKKQLDGIQQYLSYHQVPRTLQKRIAGYYEYLWDCGQDSHNDTLLEDLPRSLSLRLRLAMSRMLIERVPLFRSLESNAVLALVLHMDSSIAIPEEVVLREGDFGDTMYFINRGSVRVHKNCPLGVKKVAIGTLTVGSYFGEISLLDRYQVRTATVTAQTYCELYVLTHEHWEEAIQKYPQLLKAISLMAKNRFEDQNVIMKRAMEHPSYGHLLSQSVEQLKHSVSTAVNAVGPAGASAVAATTTAMSGMGEAVAEAGGAYFQHQTGTPAPLPSIPSPPHGGGEGMAAATAASNSVHESAMAKAKRLAQRATERRASTTANQVYQDAMAAVDAVEKMEMEEGLKLFQSNLVDIMDTSGGGQGSRENTGGVSLKQHQQRQLQQQQQQQEKKQQSHGRASAYDPLRIQESIPGGGGAAPGEWGGGYRVGESQEVTLPDSSASAAAGVHDAPRAAGASAAGRGDRGGRSSVV